MARSIRSRLIEQPGQADGLRGKIETLSRAEGAHRRAGRPADVYDMVKAIDIAGTGATHRCDSI